MAELLNTDEITMRLGSLSNWIVQDNSLVREYLLEDFQAALRFVNKVGEVAEELDHHPDILLHGWNKVRITLSTHSAGGITGNDFQLAHKIEEITAQ